jgi:hypothetical protein
MRGFFKLGSFLDLLDSVSISQQASASKPSSVDFQNTLKANAMNRDFNKINHVA